jgi:Fur family peroxide stress response transcriptional regulator
MNGSDLCPYQPNKNDNNYCYYNLEALNSAHDEKDAIMKYSRQRETVLAAVLSTDIHPSADWVYQRVRRKIPNISLATVYRNLRQLVETGQLTAVQDGKQIRYDRNLENHDHFTCRRCGRILDVSVDTASLIRTLEHKHHVRVSAVSIAFVGTCSQCSSS